MLLVIGNRNYSSWSLRPWVAMKALGLRFEEKVVPLDRPDSKARMLEHNPAGKVPCLVDGETTVWDSLAILEYLAEAHPQLWPAERAERARARSLAAEMHSGFPNLRSRMPMNVRNRFPGKGRSVEVDAEIARIAAIWNACRGPFLFGAFGAVDAMFAPVVFRLRTYAVELPRTGQSYMEAMLELPAMRAWNEASVREPEAMPQYDAMYG